MKAKLAIVLAAALLSGSAAGVTATEAASPPRQCFNARFVDGFSAPDRGHVYLRVGVNEVWAADLFGSCPDVDWTQRLGIVSHGSSFVCSGLDADLVVPGGAFGSPIGPMRCPIEHIRKLTPKEVAALPRKFRP